MNNIETIETIERLRDLEALARNGDEDVGYLQECIRGESSTVASRFAKNRLKKIAAIKNEILKDN